MSMKIVYTFRARQDLSARSPETMPERNPFYKEEPWHSQGLRFLPVKNYLLFYTVNPENSTVSIVRILYGGMDISRQLENSSEIK